MGAAVLAAAGLVGAGPRPGMPGGGMDCGSQAVVRSRAARSEAAAVSRSMSATYRAGGNFTTSPRSFSVLRNAEMLALPAMMSITW